jgi:hypothetical protein
VHVKSIEFNVAFMFKLNVPGVKLAPTGTTVADVPVTVSVFVENFAPAVLLPKYHL